MSLIVPHKFGTAGHETTQGGKKFCLKGGVTGFFVFHSDKFSKAGRERYVA